MPHGGSANIAKIAGGTAESHGPMYGITSMKAVHRPNSSAYSLGAFDEAGYAEDVHADAGTRADDGREDRLPFEVAPERALDPLRQRRAAVGREAGVDRALEALHVEEHVDRDDDDQDQREHQQDERERGALGELDRVLRVPRDLARAQRVEPLVHLLTNLDLLEPVVVEPRLEAVEIDLRCRLPATLDLVGDVLVDPGLRRGEPGRRPRLRSR